MQEIQIIQPEQFNLIERSLNQYTSGRANFIVHKGKNDQFISIITGKSTKPATISYSITIQQNKIHPATALRHQIFLLASHYILSMQNAV